MRTRRVCASLLVVLVALGCSASKKKEEATEKPKGATEAISTKEKDDASTGPEGAGSGSISPALRPPATAPTTQAARPSPVTPGAPGVCKADQDCPLKDGVPQRCCIQAAGVVAPGPALGCQSDAQRCWHPCTTDSDCPVRQACKVVPGAASFLRGCGPV